jgi:hypothetical protein
MAVHVILKYAISQSLDKTWRGVPFPYPSHCTRGATMILLSNAIDPIIITKNKKKNHDSSKTCKNHFPSPFKR